MDTPPEPPATPAGCAPMIAGGTTPGVLIVPDHARALDDADIAHRVEHAVLGDGEQAREVPVIVEPLLPLVAHHELGGLQLGGNEVGVLVLRDRVLGIPRRGIVEHDEHVPQQVSEAAPAHGRRPIGVQEDRRHAVLVDERPGEPKGERDFADRHAEVRRDGVDRHRRLQEAGRTELILDQSSVLCPIRKCHRMRGGGVDRTYGGVTMQAEGLLRTLAAAVNAVRLYPTTSPLRSEAIARFTRDAREVTRGHGPVQFYIDRKRFIFAETAIGEGLPQIAALAEAPHALQVGQLIVAPELTEQEVATFLDVLGRDAHEVRTSGGARAALLDNGVENIAVIEVTLRASSEHGLLGLDLTTAPLEDIADELQSTVAAWESTVACGEESEDMVAEAIGRLEPAARDLAMRRCAEALLLLDEETRLQMMSASLGTGPKGQQMEGMLEVVAHMQPAALARLLRLTAASLSSPAESLLPAIEFPPGLEAELAALLRPSQRSEEQSGVPPEADVVGIVADAATEDEDDLAYIGSLVAASTPKAAAARGLSTTV